jgi:hypothetical protein
MTIAKSRTLPVLPNIPATTAGEICALQTPAPIDEDVRIDLAEALERSLQAVAASPSSP